jgi:flagellar FliJ protein
MQTVLDHRQFIEDNLKKELAEIRQQVMASQLQMKSMKRKEMDTAAALKREQADGVSSDQVVAYHTYLKRLSDRITRQMTVVNEIKDQELKKQEELLQAMKKRQILEKLKDQDRDRYNQMILKKEMLFIDEIAVNQFVRKTIEKSGEGQ